MKSVFMTVGSTRHTAIGTFRLGVVYSIDPQPLENLKVIKFLTEGKDLQGKQVTKDIVGKILSPEEAEAIMQASVMGAEKGAAEQIGALTEDDPTSIDLDILEELQSQLQIAGSFAVQEVKRAEEAEDAAANVTQKLTELEANFATEVTRAEAAEAQVAELREALAKAEAEKPPAEETPAPKASKATVKK